jgi:capsular polysaccharide transport system permease protein
MIRGTADLLAIQLRVIGALVLRETRATFGTSQIGYLWAIITPTIGTALLVTIFTAAGRHPPFGNSFALFFGTGMFLLNFFDKLSSALMTAIDANRALLAYPLIKPMDIFYARAVLIGATYVLIMGIYFSSLVALGLADPPAHPLDVMAAFFATLSFGFGFGLVNYIIFSTYSSWKQVESVLTRPLIFISGVFYIPSIMPQNFIYYLKWNPVLHLIEWFRSGYYDNYNSTVLDRTFVLFAIMCLLFIGLSAERLSRKRVSH